MRKTRLIKFFALLALFALPWQFVLAQTSTDVTSIEIAQVDNSNYPDVTIYLRALDAAGQRVDGLTRLIL